MHCAAHTAHRAARQLVVTRAAQQPRPPGTLKANLERLPSVQHIERIILHPSGHLIPNAPGKAGSVAIYSHLAEAHAGKLTPAAAAEGLELYGEFTAEAMEEPGSHPNIDILLAVAAGNDASAQQTIEVVPR
jgi:hypothetical protein